VEQTGVGEGADVHLQKGNGVEWGVQTREVVAIPEGGGDLGFGGGGGRDEDVQEARLGESADIHLHRNTQEGERGVGEGVLMPEK
jgi:hypothetical protein